MSKIYDALVKAGETSRRSTTVFSRRWGIEKAKFLSRAWQDIGLDWQIMTSGMLVFGLLLVTTVYLFGRALQTQIDQRAMLITTNLSDAAAGDMMGRNILELHALVVKYARLPGSAYAFIQDSNGQIIAHSLRTFPPELRQTLTLDERRQVHKRVLTLQGKTVYETRTPILEGQLGAAHVGIWGEEMDTEIYRVVLPIVGLIMCLFVAGLILAVILAREIIRAKPGLSKLPGKTHSETVVENSIAR
ncbi:MAG TPA: hypothetical protein VFU31_24215 [Candidatus Binatia bacterium]|nr:hypothetical protein [Candidatus Binatia bacterium]